MLFTNIEFAKITIFPNIPKHLIKKSTFFNFSLEIEQIITIFAPAIMPDMGLLKLKKKKDSRLIREDQPAFLNLALTSAKSNE